MCWGCVPFWLCCFNVDIGFIVDTEYLNQGTVCLMKTTAFVVKTIPPKCVVKGS